MFSKINSVHVSGINGVGIDVEVDIASQGLPSFTVVGLAEGSLKESKERVRASLKNLGYNIFAKPITINMAPADFKKEGTHFDLPIAVGLLVSSGEIEHNSVKETVIIGELSLDGSLRSVAGVLPMVEYAKRCGFNKFILPDSNKDEAALIEGIGIYPFKSFGEVVGFLRRDIEIDPYKSNLEITFNMDSYKYDFIDVKDQYIARRGAEIAAAGMHNLIMIGTPGSGKTMIAKRLPSILPPMSIEEALITTKIHSVAGLTVNKGKLITMRPFVSPHHTASSIAIVGGGNRARPGHVSIASNGILFLDEMLEFNRNVLEVLRQPLEDKEITIARAGKTVTYPANFMLVGAMNPCPCGYFGDSQKACICSQTSINRYRAKLSGPMLDRIDLHIKVDGVKYIALSKTELGEPSKTIRSRVTKAHDIQKKRFSDLDINFNSQMSEVQLREFCKLDSDCVKLVDNAVKRYQLSARAYSKLLKTARTIADLDTNNNITSSNILEALQFRILNN